MPTFDGKTGRVVVGQWSGTNLPTTCSPGDFYIKVDAPLGQRLYTCNASGVCGKHQLGVKVLQATAPTR